MTKRRTSPPDYRQRLQVETPEHVTLDLEIAGVGSRALAALIDMLVLVGSALGVFIVLGIIAGFGVTIGSIGGALLLLGGFAVWTGYFILFEGLRQGQTPGKRMVGIRVVSDTGNAVSLGAAAARNLLRIADFLPPPYLIGALLVALHPRGKRLGDMVAGTVVARDRPSDAGRPPAARHPAGPDAAVADSRADRRGVSRAGPVREPAGAARPSRPGSGSRPRSPAGWPITPRRPASATWSTCWSCTAGSASAGREPSPGGARPRRRPLPPESGPAGASSSNWPTAPPVTGSTASRRTSCPTSPPATGRSRPTWRAPGPTERMTPPWSTSSAWRRRGTTRCTATSEAPGAGSGRCWPGSAPPRSARRGATSPSPASPSCCRPAAGFLLMREQPALAADLLPEVMIERADAGAERMAEGRRYVDVAVEDRPLMASGIITNNVRVAIACFAGGIFLGVGSLVLLGFNGLLIGATAGHFANRGLLGYLLEFILGHGLLELFAIWVAGAAGFLLGRSVVAPGDLSRGDALVLSGRTAVRMVGGAAVLLVVAGLIEGFVSAGGGDVAFRAAASVGSLAFLAAYLLNGRARRAESSPVRSPGASRACGWPAPRSP